MIKQKEAQHQNSLTQDIDVGTNGLGVKQIQFKATDRTQKLETLQPTAPEFVRCLH